MIELQNKICNMKKIARKFFIGIISILIFLFLGTRMVHAEEFQLSPENEKLLEQVNDMLITNDEQPLKIIIDDKNVSKKEYWKTKSEEECYLKINTNTKDVELKQDINGVGIKQLKRNLLRDLNKTQSVNKSLNNFLKDLKDREDKKGEIETEPGLEMAGSYITGGLILSLVVIGLLEWAKQDYY